MNIQKLIKENYEIAKSKGFYPDDSKIEDHLMGIVSELGEAYEAHRGGKFAMCSCFNEKNLDYLITHKYKEKQYVSHYKTFLSGTVEDELADVFIRLFNLCGFLNFPHIKINWKRKTIWLNSVKTTNVLLQVNKNILDINFSPIKSTLANIFQCILDLKGYCDLKNIPIEKHIKAKMEYNKTREYLHGKKY